MVKGTNLILFSGPSGIGKTTLINQGFGSVIKIDDLFIEKGGWSETLMPNSQDALKIHGLKPNHTNQGYTMDLWEKAGDGSVFCAPRRYVNEQVLFNVNTKIYIFIDSNFRQKQLFTELQRKTVIDKRMIEIQGSDSLTFFGATDLIRKINQKPPLPKKAQETNAMIAEMTFRLSDE